MTALRYIAAHYLVDRGEMVPRPVVAVDAAGCVVSVGQWEELDTMPNTEFYAGVLCAGFVNAHCHTELSYLRGAIARGGGFASFAREIGRVRRLFSAEQRQQALLAADAAMWQEGVEVVGDVVNDDSSFMMKRRSRIDYLSFSEVFGLGSTTEAARRLTENPHTSLTPHSTYSVQDAVFREIAGEGAQPSQSQSQPLSIHFMESESEAALFRGEGSLAEWYAKMGWQCDFLHYGSPARRVVESVPHDRRVLLVHNCCVGRDDVRLIESHFDSVGWVLCPRSNDYISHLQPPVSMLREEGVRICIGTDSLASNDTLSMVAEMRALGHIPLREVARWATLCGAEALGVEADKGSVERGKHSGVVLIEGVTMEADGELYLTESSTARRLV
ncbi:MAG: cytosine deaminase [Rikenellaceae bacterium]|nr:cytosine deaminase [Rikenellaceae bacterium]